MNADKWDSSESRPYLSTTDALPAAVQTDDAATGLPGLRTWRGVYLTVGGVLVLWVALLSALTFLYS